MAVRPRRQTAGSRFMSIVRLAITSYRAFYSIDQSADQSHLGQKAIVPNALKAVGQDVQKEAADELIGIERQAPWRRPVGVVLPSKTNAAVVESDEAAVGDGDPMRVTAQIGEHLAGTRKRELGVNNPFNTAQWRENGREGIGLGEPFQIS